MIDADLSGADMSAAVLIGVDLRGAVLGGANLGGVVVDSSSMARNPVLLVACDSAESHRIIDAATFIAAIGRHQEWTTTGGRSGARLDLDLTRIPAIRAPNVDLSGSRLRRCRIDGGDWSKVRLDFADLAYSDFRSVQMRGASMRGTNMRRCDLRRADFSGGIFSSLQIAGRGDWPTNLHGALMDDSVMDGTVFDHQGIIGFAPSA